ncbi:Uncharacterized protein TPAR_07197 [Tolypocladium paradoxum]|uniref:Uncharacterized protein n=1 Tax=Tolypocladium paradoxum TaxID=94208 RepID=A0A2S4KQZ4_9HYPO|nr:Uncharacterized protein TPAR_07197 [Tolypocladium paradoxum]
MLSFAPRPVFSRACDHRPAVPSPLSSSPIRASSPLSPIDKNALPQRQVQSSPIQPPKFKFASRPTRPNPVVRRREDAHESRRRNFLQGVRQKSDDKAWQRRDIEGQFLKTNWLANLGRLTHDAPDFSEADIEDAMAFSREAQQAPAEDEAMSDSHGEDKELEALVASYEEQQLAPTQRPPSPTLSDEEYDDIFAELMSQEQVPQNRPTSADQMDMTDDSGGMHF